MKNVECSNLNSSSFDRVLYVKDFATGRSIDIDNPENELGAPLKFNADRVRKAYRISLLERYEIKIRAGWLEMEMVLQNEVSQLVSHTDSRRRRHARTRARAYTRATTATKFVYLLLLLVLLLRFVVKYRPAGVQAVGLGF